MEDQQKPSLIDEWLDSMKKALFDFNNDEAAHLEIMDKLDRYAEEYYKIRSNHADLDWNDTSDEEVGAFFDAIEPLKRLAYKEFIDIMFEEIKLNEDEVLYSDMESLAQRISDRLKDILS